MVKGQPWPLELIYSHCLIKFNISSENNDLGFLRTYCTVFKNSTLKKSHLVVLGSNFDLAVK